MLLHLLLSTLLTLGPSSERDYKRWLNQEVNWIISRTEVKAFRQLQDDAARERFIQRFWLERDPSPGTPRNEYQEEHYLRLKFANEHFAEVGPGWKSDRGRVYIIHGPPVSRSIEADREIWTYNANPYAVYYKGPITLVFERSDAAFRERLISESRYAQQKAANRPGGPPNPQLQVRTTPRYRLLSAGPGFRPQLVLTAGETDRYVADILRSPGEVLEELKKEARDRQARLERLRSNIQSRVSFEELPFEFEVFSFPVPEHPNFVLRLTLDQATVHSELQAASETAQFDLYCEAREPDTDYLVDAFDATLSVPPSDTASDLNYTDRFVLPEGEQRISCLMQGLATGRTGQRQRQISAPEAARFRLLRPIMTQHIEQVAPPQEFDPTVLQDTRFLPQQRRFDRARPVYLLFHILTASGYSGKLSFDYQIHTRDRVYYRSPSRVFPLHEDVITPYALALDLSNLEPGPYFLLLKVQDSQESLYVLQEVPFHLTAVDSSPPTF